MAARDLFTTIDSAGNVLPGRNITAGTVYSGAFSGKGRSGYSLHIATPAASTLVATVTLWRSNDPTARADDANDDKWVQDTGFVSGTIVSGANKLMDEAEVTRAYLYRLKVVWTSGAGVLSAYLNDGRE